MCFWPFSLCQTAIIRKNQRIKCQSFDNNEQTLCEWNHLPCWMNAMLVSWSLKVGEEKKERHREWGREMSHAARSTILLLLPLLCWWTPWMQSVQWAGQNKLGINKTIDTTTTGCTVSVACVGGKWYHSEASAVRIRLEIQLCPASDHLFFASLTGVMLLLHVSSSQRRDGWDGCVSLTFKLVSQLALVTCAACLPDL